jgi:hypothetical protein
MFTIAETEALSSPHFREGIIPTPREPMLPVASRTQEFVAATMDSECEPDHLAPVHVGRILKNRYRSILPAEHSGAVRDSGRLAGVEVVLVFNKVFRVLGHAEFFEPIRNRRRSLTEFSTTTIKTYNLMPMVTLLSIRREGSSFLIRINATHCVT